jgi:twitching motility protein PilT
MAAQKVPLLGRLAVHLKMIDMDQLAEAVRQCGRIGEDKRLGEVLVEQGMIDQAQLAKLLQAQHQVVAKQRAKQAGVLEKPARPQAEPVAPPAATRVAPAVPEPVTAVAESPRPEPVATPAPAPPEAAAPKPAASHPQKDLAGDGPAPIAVLEDLARFGAEDRQRLEQVLRDGVAQGASDLHFHAGAPVRMRVSGALHPLPGGEISSEEVERAVLASLSEQELATFAERGEIDACHTFEGIGRFRANIFRQQRGVDGVFRYIPASAPSLEELGLPAQLARFTTYHQGMVLVTGPTGCGKSSTLAALVDLVNEERREHILTIEDPIEYIHPSKRCLVNQRSVHAHTGSFARALRAALREDPDVIVIGELRDLETISLALSAAETGHFVLATLHTENAIRTINRLVGSFPADQQEQIRTMISESLRAVISQRLLPRADGKGRVAAFETLVVTKAVGNLIRENKTFQIQSILQTGASQGMQLLDESIGQLVKAGTVSREEAMRHVEDLKVLAA